jgi:nitrogen fixation-related uncharacterized protein
MRVILKILMVLVGIAAFFGIVAGGVFYAYGQYAVPLIDEQLTNAEIQIEDSLEEEYPGSEVDVEFLEVFYKVEGLSAVVAFKVNAEVNYGDILDHEETNYAAIDIMSVITGSPEFETYDETQWAGVEDQYKQAPAILFDAAEAKKVALTILIISAVAFVGSIVVNAVFLRKKRV